jgi:hypothetical protein
MGIIALYVFLSLLNVWAAGRQKKRLFYITKPLLIPVLIGVYVINSPLVLMGVMLALFFAWLGDIFLLYNLAYNEDLNPHQIKSILVLGGTAFAGCHIAYTLTFLQIRSLSFAWPITVIFIILFTIYIRWFYKVGVCGYAELDPLFKIGIKLYIIIILMMSISSTLLIDADILPSFLPFVGSLLFIVSDSLLAAGYKNQNNRDVSYHPWVMAAYLSAQFFIIIGLVFLGI